MTTDEREALRGFVYQGCECGGRGPNDDGVCLWCLLWHAMLAVENTPAEGEVNNG